jgi:hypothetical protein
MLVLFFLMDVDVVLLMVWTSLLLFSMLFINAAYYLFLKFSISPRSLLHKSVLVLRDEALMEAISSLLSLGINVNERDSLDKTPLHYACSLGLSRVVSMLIEHGADCAALDGAGNTALHFALLPSVAEMLLEHNNTNIINVANAQGNTALHVACAFGLLETKSVLLAWGAVLSTRNGHGNTPLDLQLPMPPKTWKIHIPMSKSDDFDVATGGIVIDDAPKLEKSGTGLNLKNLLSK